MEPRTVPRAVVQLTPASEEYADIPQSPTAAMCVLSIQRMARPARSESRIWPTITLVHVGVGADAFEVL
jgi:hypothetical protein